MTEYAVDVKNLKKMFKDGHGTTFALKGIDLKIKKNQIYGLLGPNGAGKTTLIYILSNLVLPSSGEAKVLGYNVYNEGKSIREKSGLCIGGTYLYFDMTPREILKYFGMMYGIKSSVRKKNVDELIKKLGIDKFEKKRFSDLSTGMRQKVAVAKSLINDPEILFLDEPTSGLDVEVSLDVRDFITDLIKERDMTVILTSHYLGEVEQMCKKMTIINKGKVVINGDIKQIKRNLKIPDVIHLYLKDYKKLDFVKNIPGVTSYCVSDGLFIAVDSGLDRVESVIEEFKRKEIKIVDMEIKKASLEEAFLTIVGRKGCVLRKYGEMR